MRFEDWLELQRKPGEREYLSLAPDGPNPYAGPDADPHWRPAPTPDGSLVQDPDFELPTSAGSVRWALYHDSAAAGEAGPWGYGRRGSFPLKLTSDGTTVTVMHEDGTLRRYVAVTGGFRPDGANYDTLTRNADGSWDETLWETGFVYHYPAGNSVSVAYRQTPPGGRLTYSYDAAGRLESVMEPAGRRVTLGYAAGGVTTVQYVQDWGDRRNTLTYDAADDLVEEQGPGGCITQYDYDAQHRLTGILDPDGYETTYTYDGAGRVASRSVAGSLSRYTYLSDASGFVTMTYHDPLGRVWTHTADPSGSPRGRIDPLGNQETYTYLGYRLVEATDVLGNSTSYAYDGNGFLTAVRDPLGYRVTWTRDGYGNLLAQTDARGYRTTYSYGANPALRQPVTVMNALGHLTTYAWLANGRLRSIEDPLGHRLTFGWTEMAQIDSLETPLGARFTQGYDLVGNRVEATDPLGRRSTYAYDPMGRLLQEQNALGYVRTTLYDARGMVQAEIDPLGYRTSYLWNAEGSRRARIDALGHRTTWAYDAANQLVAWEDARGYRTSYLYDLAGRRTEAISPGGFPSTSVYDGVGRRAAWMDPNGGRWSVLYDARGLETALQDPLGALTTFQYDGNRNRVLRVDARANPTTYGMDALDREVQVRYPDGSLLTYVYDAADRLAELWDASGRRLIGYDPSSRLTSVRRLPGEWPLTYAYDAAANRVSMEAYLDGRTTYAYDALDRVVEIWNPSDERTTLLYDPLDRETWKMLANGTTVSRAFDPAGRETVLENRAGDGAALAVYTATYDPAGNRLTVLELDGAAVTYAYDGSSQLVGEERGGAVPYQASYTYDGAGNRLLWDEAGALTTYQYDLAQELILVVPPSGIPSTLAWDANGNLLTESAAAGETSYAWDYEDRLTGAAYPGGARETHTYLAEGLRWRRETGDGATLFLWDGPNLLLETDPIPTLLARYTDLPGAWGGLSSQRRAGDSSFYAFDLQSSTRLLLSAAGAVTDEYVYRAFGEEVLATGNTLNPFRYVGLFGYYRDAPERYYVRARWLRVDHGRWLSRDPLPEELYRYRYVGNNPLGWLDPSGLTATCGFRTAKECLAQCAKSKMDRATCIGLCGILFSVGANRCTELLQRCGRMPTYHMKRNCTAFWAEVCMGDP